MTARQEEMLPPRALPTVYFAAAHVALVFALLVPALFPERVAGFFLHARMLAVVHLVTLGWITHSILGATYVVAPMALRMPMKARAVDWVFCVATMVGAAGVIAHFWIDGYSGVAWSGGTLAAVFVMMAVRIFRSLRGAKAPAVVRAHVGLAYTNLVLTAILGTVLAVHDKSRPLPEVYAHAHVAVVGWATLLFMGVGYRLLPMFLPAAPPKGPLLWASALLVEIGVLGFVASFFFRSFPAAVPALALAAGVAVFLANVVRMLLDRRPAPKKMKRPDLGMLHTGQALLYLLLATALGLFLALSKGSHPELLMLYGVFGLLGFLGQAILGVAMRLLPIFAWTQAWVGSGFSTLPTNPHEMPARPLQYAALALWTAGVPVLAYGLYESGHPLISVGAWLLVLGTGAGGINAARVLKTAFAR